MSVRLTTVTGTLTGTGGAPLAGATVTASLVGPLGATDFSYTGDGGAGGIVISPAPVTTTTASDGTWSLALVAPGDLSPAACHYVVSASGLAITTTAFAYSATPLTLLSIDAGGSTPFSTTALIYDYVIDPAGNPVVGAKVTCRTSQNAINTTNNVSIPANVVLETTTGSNGYYSFNIVPNADLSPNGVYYLVYENGTTKAKAISVPSAGGLVNALQITPITPGSGVVAQNAIGADLTEAATFDTLGGSSTLVNNLDRIRWVLAQYTGGAWDTATLFAQLDPLVQQLGNILIAGSITANGGLVTSGLLSVGGNAVVDGALTVNGSLVGAAVPNVATVPSGASAMYTTPHGRMTFGNLAIFL